MNRHFYILFAIVISLFSSCATTVQVSGEKEDVFQGQLYFVDRKTGKFMLQYESTLITFLNEIIENPELYNMRVFERSTLKHQKKTKLWRHTYYLITNAAGEYHTLSFYGTVFTFYSEGAWGFDADYDMVPFKMYLNDTNHSYMISEIHVNESIDVKETARNIIKKIQGDRTYYLLDHVDDKKDKDNCITALYETIVFKTNQDSYANTGNF